MPGLNWFKEHPELNLEVVGLDMNRYVASEGPVSCHWTPCWEECERNLNARSAEGLRLFYERAAASTARNMLVFSHYPTDYFRQVPGFIQGLSDNSKRSIAYFGGHRHNVDNTS